MNVFLIVPVFFIAVGVWGLIRENDKQENCFYRQIATFVEYVEDTDVDSDGFVHHIYFPVFSYTFNNDVYIEQLDIGSNDCPYQKGDEVEIGINPEIPTQYVIMDKKKSNKIFFILFIALSVAAFVLSFFGQ